jgi:Fur family ferric uptake transcriptional regulator
MSRSLNSRPEASRKFYNYLKKRELRNTPERFLILNQISEMNRHFEADSLLVQLKINNKKISRATIYRTLELLVDCGLVKKINLDAQHAFYEAAFELNRHDHFVCSACGKIIEFYDETINKIQRHLQAVYGLEVVHYSYHLSGYCASCLKKLKHHK